MPGRKDGNQKRQQIIEFFHDYHEIHRLYPTVGEVAEELKMSKSTVHHHLKVLVEEGKIKEISSSSRNFVLVDETKEPELGIDDAIEIIRTNKNEKSMVYLKAVSRVCRAIREGFCLIKNMDSQPGGYSRPSSGN